MNKQVTSALNSSSSFVLDPRIRFENENDHDGRERVSSMSSWLPFRWRPDTALRWLLLVLLLTMAVRHWAWSPMLVQGDSMCPTLHSGQLKGINKLAYHFAEPRRGDIVAVWTDHDLMVKRIIGLPGEQIECREGVFYLNGQPFAEPYVKLTCLTCIRGGKLGPDCFVVAGDNRSQTVLAVVRRNRIIGRVAPTPFPESN
jgi:signal peptidase I